MKFHYLPRLSHFLLGAFLACLSSWVLAQSTGRLYDPEPPVDSAYVRIVLASKDSAIDVSVDGHSRIQKLGAGESSDYMVLSAGKHAFSIHGSGKSVALFSTSIDVVRGKAITIALTSLKPDVAPVIFEDKINSNKLKALLTVYHLDSKIGNVDLLTADGNTKIFTNLAYAASSSIQVNPISVDIIAVKSGEKAPVVKSLVQMTQGGSYSIFLLSDGSKSYSKTVLNQIERYTGK
jgi:alginate O-acetyltransferase complex protein AlgF